MQPLTVVNSENILL